MSGQRFPPTLALRGTIRRRLLINAVVDPDEAAARLPGGLRPHVTPAGTVVGCCLLEIDGIRPMALPAVLGVSLRAAAHRISVEWDDLGGPGTGVYVPMRHTNSRPATLVGGRVFPGVHRRATLDVTATPHSVRWTVYSDALDVFDLRLDASMRSDRAASPACEPVGGACLAASVGLSPGLRGVLEAVRMDPDHRVAREVVVEHLDSAFLSSFSTAVPAPSYVMTDVGVTWTPTSLPQVSDKEMSR